MTLDKQPNTRRIVEFVTVLIKAHQKLLKVLCEPEKKTSKQVPEKKMEKSLNYCCGELGLVIH